MDENKTLLKRIGCSADPAGIFSYDPDRTLDLRDEGLKTEDGISIHDVSFAGLAQERIRAFLVEPKGEHPCAGILFVHPGPGDRSTFLEEAKELAGLGAACLLIDAPWADGAAFGRRAMSSSEVELRTWYIQIATDLRRSVDLLTRCPHVDPGRISYVGHSSGALFGGILAGVEKRISSFVLMAGVGSFTDVAVLNIPTLTGEPLEKFRITLDPIDPVHYIGYAPPAAIFFQFGNQDHFYPRQKFIDFYSAARDPKSIRWYDAGHYLDAAARIDRIDWLKAQLNLATGIPR